MSADLPSRELTITRTFAAPAALVFRMWTDPVHLARWWGPRGFTNPVCEVDARPGGALRIVMRGPDGATYPMVGTFHDIEPRRLVFGNIATDAAGNHILEGLTTVTFVERDGWTEMTLHISAAALVAEAAKYLAGMAEGWGQSIDRLGELAAAG